MTAAYTFDVFSSLDGFGAHSGNWGGYWGKQGPELLDHRLAPHSSPPAISRSSSMVLVIEGHPLDPERRLP